MARHSGLIIFGTFTLYLVSVVLPFFRVGAAVCAWLVPFVVWSLLNKSVRKQTLLLLLTGMLTVMYSASKGVFLGWMQIFAANVPLLAMFVAVSFLSLTNPVREDPDLPKGRGAVVSTAIGTHLLGAVINLSVLFVFGDRLQKKAALSGVQLIILPRAFCAAAWWSPFFIATGVALIYAPAMAWKETLVPGIIMGGIAITYSILEVSFFRKEVFYGYPLKAESLVVPLFLAAVVLGCHYFRRDINILLLICLVAPLGAVVFMKGRPRARSLRDFVENRISSVSSQFALFLAAGVFSSGLKSITQVHPEVFSLEGTLFTHQLFAILLAVMILAGVIGVHPVISIAIVSPLLLPLNPDHSQLGFLFLSSWAISTACSPLSGVGLALVSRFQAKPRSIILQNWHYAIAMWAAACLVNKFYF